MEIIVDENHNEEQNSKAQLLIETNNEQQNTPIKQYQQFPQQNHTEQRTSNQIKEQVTQRLQVNIFPKTNLQNQQKQNIQQQNSTHPYGPFHQNQNSSQFNIKNAHESTTSDIEISPILTNHSPGQFKQLKKKDNYKRKKSSNILTEESNHQFQLFSKINQAELQRQILALAKSIRQKVKMKQLKKDENIIDKKSSRKSNDSKQKKIHQKKQIIFSKYSFPRSTGIDLCELQKEQARLHLGKFSIQRVPNQYQLEKPTMQNLQTSPEKSQNQMQVKYQSQPKTQKRKKQKSSIQLPKLKLNLDKTHHRYEMNQFRKNILKEKKDRQIAQSLIIKDKEEALQKRRQIYNQSRYHPVGIKLNALRTSRLPNAQQNLKQKFSETDRHKLSQDNKDFFNLSLMTPQKQNSLHKQENQSSKEVDSYKVNLLPQFSDRTIQKMVNNSEGKESLTFNFSLSDEINPGSEYKTSIQIINDVRNLTKEVQNDSDINKKCQNDSSNGLKSISILPKKWSSIDKQLTESKHIISQSPSGLHNFSSTSFNSSSPNYNNIELQYSNI